MENEKVVSQYVHEGTVAMMERTIRRLWITTPMGYSAADFAEDNPRGTFVLGFGGHCCTVVNGDIYDSWDSSNEKPIYVWFREEKR